MTRSLRGRIQLSLVVAFIAILSTPLFACNYMVPGATIDVVETGFAEGEPGQVIETSPYVPSRHFCAVNETPFMRDNWWYGYTLGGLRRYVYLGTQGVTSALFEVTFRALNASCTLQLGLQVGVEDDVRNTTAAQPHETKTLTFNQSINDSEGWLRNFIVFIRTNAEFAADVVIQSFRVWVSADPGLCPLSFALERPDGENLIQYARTNYDDDGEYYRYYDIYLNLDESYFYPYFYPWGETDIVYLRPGDYSGTIFWYSHRKQDFSVSLAANSSVQCRIQIPVMRLNITCTPNVPGYDVFVSQAGYDSSDEYALRTGVEENSTKYVWPGVYADTMVDCYIRPLRSGMDYVFPWNRGGHLRFTPNASANYDVIVRFHQPQFGSALVVLQYVLLAVFLGCLAVALAAYVLIPSRKHASVSLSVRLGLVPVFLFVLSLVLPWSTNEFTIDHPWEKPPVTVTELTFPGLATRMLFSEGWLFITGFRTSESGIPMVFWSLTLLMILALPIRRPALSLTALSILTLIGFLGEGMGVNWLLEHTRYLSPSIGLGPYIAFSAFVAAVAGWVAVAFVVPDEEPDAV